MRGVHFHSMHLKKGLGNLPVQFVVLCQQDTAVIKIRLFSLFLNRTAPFDSTCKRAEKRVPEQWLWYETIHPCLPGIFLYEVPVIGRYHDDCGIRSHQTADLSGCLNPVHIRHLPVNQGNVIVCPLTQPVPHFLQRLKTGIHPDRIGSGVLKDFYALAPYRRVIIHHQDSQPV